MASESKLQAKVLKWLKSRRVFAVKIISATEAGSPDILCCARGRFCVIECKSEAGKVSALQLAKIEKIARADGLVFVVRPSTFEAFKGEFERRTRSWVST